MMDFFKQLRKAAKTAEEGVQNVESQLQAKDDDYSYEKRNILMLNRKLQETKQCKTDCMQVLEELQKDDIVEFVDVSQKLVARMSQMLASTEQHLQRYGFQPLEKLPKEQVSIDEKENGDANENDKLDCESHMAGEPAKLASPPRSVKAAHGGIPTMAEFGISESTIRMLQNRPRHSPPASVTAAKQSHGEAGSRSFSADQKSSAPGSHDDRSVTPEPPVLMTPGFNSGRREMTTKTKYDLQSLEPLSYGTPEAPELTSRWLSAQTVTSTTNASSTSTTHASSTSTTNASSTSTTAQQNNDQPSQEAEPYTREQPARTARTYEDTPEAPDITFTYKFLQDTAPLGDVSVGGPLAAPRPQLPAAGGVQSDTPEPPELTFSFKNFKTAGKTKADAGCDNSSITHETPAKLQTPAPSSGHPGAAGVSASNLDRLCAELAALTPVRTRPEQPQFRGFSLPETPKMPELTGRYDFSFNPRADEVAQELASAYQRDSEVEGEAEEEGEEDKENVQPAVNPHPGPSGTPPLSAGKSTHERFPLAQVTAEEYSKQPDYVRNVLGFKDMTSAVDKVNSLLVDKVKGGQLAGVVEGDLRDVLSHQQAIAFLVVMIRIGRLTARQERNLQYYVSC